MSRHRNVRSMNYTDECEGYDDVYGHSVEDDYSISPSVQGFMYDRSRPPEMSAFLNEENDIAEEDEDMMEHMAVDDNLSEVDQARLISCIEEIQNIIGDSVPLHTLKETVIRCEFDCKKALDCVLNENSSKSSKTKIDPLSSSLFPLDKVQVISAESTHGELATGKVLAKANNVTKGFDVSGLRPTSPATSRPHSRCASPMTRLDTPKGNNGSGSRNTSRCASPASGRASPDPDRRHCESKPAKLRVDVEAAYAADRGNSKAQLHMVVIGHVDAGKSTLMGHLLHDLGHVNQRTMHKYEQESKKIGKQSFLYAWILDETGEERSRGITMDVGQSRFETATKSVYLLDAPGHKDFIPNMISGAAQADVAVLVVDATRGEFETGFESGGQTREHALLIRALGVSQLAVAVNKLDTVGWSQERFEEIRGKLTPFLKQAGFRDSDVSYVPCSGLIGENLVKPSNQDLLLSWYSGPTLLDVIDNFKSPERPITKPLRMTIGDVFKGVGSGQSVAGRIETGMLQPGDKVLVLPLNEATQAKSVLLDEMPAQAAYAGDSVSVTLQLPDASSLTIGSVLCDPLSPAPVVTVFEARIVVFNISIPITMGYPVVLHAHATSEQATITGLISLLHKSSGEVIKRRPRCLTRQSSAVVKIQTARPVCLELYKDVKELGRVMLRVNGVSIAAGLVTKLL